jgi:ATP adenylyltransferase/5',5'''-P-1,P-4-tetraphosphate phosphorylase II
MRENMTKPGKTINDQPVNDLIEQNNFANAAKKLLERQKETWPILKSGYDSLSSIKTKRIKFDGFRFIIQFNPGRYISTSSKVDDKSINDRNCFLCQKNLQKEQEEIMLNDYILLGNPYPIFPEHFTIASIKHKNQRIHNSFKDLLFFSKLLSKYYTVFYNGPQCGASAPDHLHFQAGSKHTMPLDDEYDSIKIKFGQLLSDKNECEVYFINDRLRKIISIEGKDDKYLTNIFNSFYNKYSAQLDLIEPLMNILCLYEEEKGWRVLIMLRAKHRPKEFYYEGSEKILFSPAACDYGGLCITPREKDFNRLDKVLLTNIFHETSIGDLKFQLLKEEMKSII